MRDLSQAWLDVTEENNNQNIAIESLHFECNRMIGFPIPQASRGDVKAVGRRGKDSEVHDGFVMATVAVASRRQVSFDFGLNETIQCRQLSGVGDARVELDTSGLCTDVNILFEIVLDSTRVDGMQRFEEMIGVQFVPMGDLQT